MSPSFEQIDPQSGVAFKLKENWLLEVRDPKGGQVADLFCVDDETRKDALSSGRSIDYNETVCFTRGHTLFGHSGRPMLKIIEDSCGVHDFLVTPCSLQMFKMLNPDCTYHPSCEENLISAFKDFDVDQSVIATTFNIFMNVPIKPGGSISVQPPISKAGDRILLLCKRDLIVGLTACSDEGSNGGSCKPIQYRIIKPS